MALGAILKVLATAAKEAAKAAAKASVKTAAKGVTTAAKGAVKGAKAVGKEALSQTGINVVKKGGKVAVKESLKQTGAGLAKSTARNAALEAAGMDSEDVKLFNFVKGAGSGFKKAHANEMANRQNLPPPPGPPNGGQSPRETLNNNIIQQAFQAFIGKDNERDLGYGGYVGRTGGDFFRNQFGLETTHDRQRAVDDKMEKFRMFQQARGGAGTGGPAGGMLPQQLPQVDPYKSMGDYVTANQQKVSGFPGGAVLKSHTQKNDPYGFSSSTYENPAAGIAKKVAEDQYGAQKEIPRKARFLEQFERTESEVNKKFKHVGDASLLGTVQRFGARRAEDLGLLPETRAFENNKLVLANQFARNVEGGRVTDQDRQVYADAMADVTTNPSKTNIRLASGSLLDLKDKGGDVSSVIKQLRASKSKVMNSIADEVEGKKKKENTIDGLTDDEAYEEYLNVIGGTQ